MLRLLETVGLWSTLGHMIPRFQNSVDVLVQNSVLSAPARGASCLLRTGHRALHYSSKRYNTHGAIVIPPRAGCRSSLFLVRRGNGLSVVKARTKLPTLCFSVRWAAASLILWLRGLPTIGHLGTGWALCDSILWRSKHPIAFVLDASLTSEVSRLVLCPAPIPLRVELIKPSGNYQRCNGCQNRVGASGSLSGGIGRWEATLLLVRMRGNEDEQG